MIKNITDLKYYIQQDRFANGRKDKRTLAECFNNLFFPTAVSYLRTLRWLEYCINVHNLWNRLILPYYRLSYRINCRRLGYYIGVNVCGPGLSLPHYGTIIISGEAKIGANCRIHTCVNIGRSGGDNKAPIIGDNVYIGPSCVLFGDIIIASNVTIGANATVNKSCDRENVVLAGSPAVIVKENYPNWIEFNNRK